MFNLSQFLFVTAAVTLTGSLLLLSGSSAEPRCGGALDGDEGSLTYYDGVEDEFGDRPCVWVIRLHSATNLSVTIDSLSPGLTLNVFTSAQALSGFPLVLPAYVFNESTLDTTFRSGVSTFILILRPAPNTDRDFTLSWRGEGQGTGLAPIEAANYVDADAGTIEFDDFGLAVVALVLNPPNGDKIDIEISVPSHESGCAEIAYGIFQITQEGALRETIRSCGQPDRVPNLPSPLIAFVGKLSQNQSEVVALTWKTVNAGGGSGSSCGGTFQSNQGMLEFEDVGDPTFACAWSLRLQSKFGLRLTVLELSTKGGAGIFSSAQAGSPLPTIPPAFALNETDVGRPIDVIGEVILVILNASPTGEPRKFRLIWDGVENAPGGSSESLSYVDANEGTLTHNDVSLTLSAFILNPPTPWPLEGEIKVLGFEETCGDVTFGIYNVTDAGNLREVKRSCGVPVTFRDVRAPLISFLVKATQAQSETAYLNWRSVRPPPEEVTSTTPDPTLVESTECGGVLVGSRGFIRYKLRTPYQRNERCVWTIRAELFAQVHMQLVDDGLYTVPGFDYLTISTIPSMDSDQIITTDRIINGGYRSPFTVRGPIVFVTFRTTQGGPRGFELSFEGDGTSVPNRAWSHLHFNTSLDSVNEFRYPVAGGNYQDTEFVTLVFNQGLLNLQYRLNLLFEFVDLENSANCQYDVVSVHEADRAANIEHKGRFCPANSNTERPYTSTLDGGTFIVVFRTDGSVTQTGFRGRYSYIRV